MDDVGNRARYPWEPVHLSRASWEDLAPPCLGNGFHRDEQQILRQDVCCMFWSLTFSFRVCGFVENLDTWLCPELCLLHVLEPNIQSSHSWLCLEYGHVALSIELGLNLSNSFLNGIPAMPNSQSFRCSEVMKGLTVYYDAALNCMLF